MPIIIKHPRLISPLVLVLRIAHFSDANKTLDCKYTTFYNILYLV